MERLEKLIWIVTGVIVVVVVILAKLGPIKSELSAQAVQQDSEEMNGPNAFLDAARKRNKGFAFNEGWAENWAGTLSTCAGDPTNFNYEGNVATALNGLEQCVGRKTMVQVLQQNPAGVVGGIHSYSEFRATLASISTEKIATGRRFCLSDRMRFLGAVTPAIFC